MSIPTSSTAVCLSLTRAISKSRTVEEIYTAALDALASGLDIHRSSILLFDADGTMRFTAYRGISESYRRAVEGHTPWTPETRDPEPIVVADVTQDESLRAFLPVFAAENIAALVFIPLVSQNRVIGKFMLYLDAPGSPSVDQMELAGVIAMQVAFAVERTRTEAQARRNEAAAEDASRLKDEFLATLSHELRTPLNAILGWVQMLVSGQLSPERTRQALDVIGRNARLQQQLIEDILDVSRIITGKLELERIPVSVPSLLDTVVAGAAPAAEARQISFVQRVEPGLPPIEGDPKRLHQILNNVLSNAIKFSAPGGTITIECGPVDRWLEISIRDRGAGIAKEFLPYVFDRFRQADSRATRTHGGLGLGLAIARHLVEEHDGEIRAESDGPGQGTTIVIRLPAGLADEALAGARPVAKRAAGVSLDDLAVLVVDDQADSREMLTALLEHAGARVFQCEGAVSALELLACQHIDVIIADIAMPDVDGYQLLQRARAAGHAMPAIAVTAFARPDNRERARSAGFTAYCAKPIDAAHLIATVRGLVSIV